MITDKLIENNKLTKIMTKRTNLPYFSLLEDYQSEHWRLIWLCCERTLYFQMIFHR